MDGVDAKASLGQHDQRYRLDFPLGEGGMAVVWRGYDAIKKKLVAIKVVRGGGRATSVRVKRLTAELRALSRLESARHPNLVQVYAFHEFEDPDTKEQRAFIVMEYVDGGNVEQQLHALGRLPPRRAVRWIVQVLSALGAAHRVGVVHRDIKPSNILLDHESNAVLADFGIALLLDDDDRFTRTGVMMGSVAYAAPEQRLSASEARPTADLYATGATLYQMLTGERPDHLFAESPDHPRWQIVDEPLRDVLVKAMQKDPASRYQTADEMADALEACTPTLAPDELADTLQRFPARGPDSRDGVGPTLGQTLTDDGLPEFDQVADDVGGSSRAMWAAVSVAVLALVVWSTWTPASAPVAPPPATASVVAATEPAASPPVAAPPAPPDVAAGGQRLVTDAAPRRVESPPPHPKPPPAPEVSPELAPLAGTWHRNGASFGPATLELSGRPSALTGRFTFVRAGVVQAEGPIDQGTWDPGSGRGSIEFVHDGPVLRLDFELQGDGTLRATCCGGGTDNKGDIQYRRSR